MCHARLIQELLLRVRTERYNPIVEALFLDPLIRDVVVNMLFGTVWRRVEPLSRVSFFSLLHDRAVNFIFLI